jgi:hypothetical protein
MGSTPNLIIIQDETESTGDRFERREAVCGFFDPTEDQLCPSKHERLELWLAVRLRALPNGVFQGIRVFALSRYDGRRGGRVCSTRKPLGSSSLG